MADIQIISELTDHHVLELVELYRNEFWSKSRTCSDVVKMLAASDVIVGLVDERDRLVGFTRVLTDFVYRATIYDVIVKPTHRQQGLGVQLINAVIHHPQLCNVEQFALYCLPEMFPFYERWGFCADTHDLQLMFRGQQS
ncbi:MAG: GNAT family N-acetyltransferase [Leptolyngbyaceae cyanobacterium RU_5_1]|nr:GNAT family N-acetyltransferase [Leptolyngbyaceae cyanobacterium RU_5_1]